MVNRIIFPPFINDFYLMLTEKCPMRCKYCYIRNRENGKTMTIEIIDKFFNHIKNKKNTRVIFFGGEPLLELNLIEYILDKYRHIPSSFQVVTSGIVNLEKFIDDIYLPNKDIFDLQISWDGFNNNRLLINNNDTSIYIHRLILKLINRGVIFQTRTVINDENIDALYDLYLYFEELHNKFDNFSSDFTIAHQVNFNDNFFIRLDNNITKILNRIENRVKSNEKLFIPQFLFNIILGGIDFKKISACNVGFELIIRPNGDIYPCTMISQIENRDIFKLGSVFDRKLKNIDILENIHKYPTKCNNCEYKSACGGGCRYERVSIDNSLDCINPNYCLLTKTIYNTIKNWMNNLDKEVKNIILLKSYNFMQWISYYETGNYEESKKYRNLDNISIS